MITTSRFLGYDKNEYGDLIVNRKEAEIVSLTFDLYLLNVGSSRIGELLDYMGVKTVTGTTWESGTINGLLCNEKYKGDFQLQKYYTPENKRNHTRKNNGEVQSYYISENHEPIVSPEVWEKVQEVREQRKRDRNIGQNSTMKFQNRYPLSGMLICPYCGKTLRRRRVYKKKIQWLCSTYIEKRVKACKGIRIDDAELQGLNITEQTVIEEVVKMARSITVIPAKQISTAESGTAQSVQKLRMAAYCQVSTDQEEQLLSYENQVNYYTNYISENPLYEYAGTYADEGISGTNTKKRDEFNRMIADCRAGKIDMIITKSISRFARNTLDCLNYVRELKDLGIGTIFEKENINTLDAKGEVLLTILSLLAQDESRSISENCTWGIRRRFETGKHKMSTKRFLGYDTDETGKLVINRTQEPIVIRLYQEFLDGKTTDYIKRIFEREGVKNWDGGTKWQSTTLMSMLENEKYKGDALLQKSYTVDFLTKKRTQNKGKIQMFYVEDDHDAIISKRIWECVQLEIKRRKKYLEEHGTNSYSHRPESNPFASKIICGDCNKVFARKGWRSSTGVDRKVWQCSERYKVKGVMGCANRHVEEETLIKAYLMAWNALVENREDFMEQWTEQLQSENLLEGYRAEKFIEYTDGAEPLTEMDTDFMLKTLDHIKVFEDGTLLVVFLDGTEIECKNEEE